MIHTYLIRWYSKQWAFHPERSLIIHYMLYKNRMLTLRLMWAMGARSIPATAGLGKDVAIIAYEELLVPAASRAAATSRALRPRFTEAGRAVGSRLAPVAPIARVGVAAAGIGIGIVGESYATKEIVRQRTPWWYKIMHLAGV